jgi:TPR repeat protein
VIDTGTPARLPQRSIEQTAAGAAKPTVKNLQSLEAQAAAGSVVAQRQLAAAYLRGSGVTRDPARAAQWYRKAAARGDAESQYVLSGMYFKGIGVPRDPSVAMEWLRRAAAQGHSGARAQLTQTGN